jgi:pimeloyl-ACP methyl ester carboxylesterase
MFRFLIAVACSIFVATGIQAQAWHDQFDTLIKIPPGPEQEKLIADMVAARPAWQDVMGKIRSISFPDTTKGHAFLRQTTCIDGVTRPYVIYVPTTYDPKTPAPMLVILHGSVSRPEIMPDPKGWAEKTVYIPLAEKYGWFVLFPMGQAEATWWDEVGMTNILTLIRTAKIDFNIDDDKVYLGGFSDGASAAFLFAMTMPTDFAAFLALNGHMGVGSEDGDLPTYAANFINSSIYATTTDKDQLYPTAQMERTIALASKAGAKIYYRRLEGEHNINDVKGELPAIFDLLEKRPRNSFPDTIIWEAAVAGFGVCKWLAIDEVTIDEPAGWYVDYNIAMVDSSITIGFQPADSFSGAGVMVAALADGDYLAKRIGLKSGDIIVKGNDSTITNMEDLTRFKNTLHRGGDVSMTIKRGGNEMLLQGRMPAPENYFLFYRKHPSAVIKASFSNNQFDIQGSRVGAFRILLNPDMVDLNKNVTVIFDGEKIFDARVAPDIKYILRDYLTNRDRKLVFANEVKLRPAK